MTTNWIEEIKSKFKISHSKESLDKFNKKFKTPEERLLWSIFGKTDDKSPEDKLIDFITTLLEKQREEYVEMIKGVNFANEEHGYFYGENYAFKDGVTRTKDKIINLIKSHDKTS